MNNDNASLSHSAAQSMQGYLYQCRVALYEMLKKLPDNSMATVSIETLDDVVFENNGTPTDIIQLKHRVNKKANLTDASVDLWKTIGIWVDLFNSKSLNFGTVFVMMTTEVAPSDSIAFFLSTKDRDINSAIQKLNQTAQTSTNEATRDVRNKFLSLSEEGKKELLRDAYILASSFSVHDIESELAKILYHACPKDKIPVFLEYLEGWWFQRILKSFSDSTKRAIIGEELDAKLNEFRESLKSDSLPIHPDLRTADVDGEAYKDYVFVHQLKIIDIGAKRISIAVNNYYRAFEQRSRWMREKLLYVGDVDDYEKRLVEEWETHFESMKEDIGEKAAEEEKVKAAKKLYEWVEQDANIPIKDKCNELFITRGSYQMLSDRQTVGWHVEFKERLEKLLGVSSEVAR